LTITSPPPEPEADEDGNWVARGRCRGAVVTGAAADHEFFPELEIDTRWQHARDRLCAPCPVRAECLLFALEHRYVGLWGGELLTPATARAFRRHYGVAA
jgi:hypothetical protein